MFRYSLIVLAALYTSGPAAAASWADALFEELSKDFGSVPRGPTLSHPFRLKNNTKSLVGIAGMRVSCNRCVTAHALKYTLEPGEETTLVVNLDTTKFSGIRNFTVYVTFDRPQAEEVRLWVQANSRDDVSVTPDNLALGKVKRGSSPAATATVTFLGNALAQVLEATCDSNYVQPALKELRRQGNEVSYELTAKLRADAPVGKWYSDIWLKTNVATMPKVRVPLTVEIESALSVSPTALALGEVKAGTETERKVIVRGVKPFRVTAFEGADDRLTVTDSTAESKPQHVLTVTLKADKPGDVNRTIKVITDLKEEGEIEFQIRARVGP